MIYCAAGVWPYITCETAILAKPYELHMFVQLV